MEYFRCEHCQSEEYKVTNDLIICLLCGEEGELSCT